MADPAHRLRLVDTLTYERAEGGGSGSGGDELKERVEKLENLVTDVRLSLARIEGKLETLSTKEGLGSLAERVSRVEGSLEGKLGYWQFLTTSIGLGSLFIAAMTLVLRWPDIKPMLGIP